MRRLVGLTAAILALSVAGPAVAATMMFNTGGSNVNGGKNFTAGTGADTTNVHVTAWSLKNNTVYAASIGQYSEGLGVSFGSRDQHTVDNSLTRSSQGVDFLIFQFDRAVALQTATFTTGWFGLNDTDASISRANVDYALIGSNYNTTGTAFWNAASSQLTNNLYSSASVGKSGNSTRSIAPNSPTLVTSNVWLISAKIGDVDTYGDSFKLKGITYALPVPPPPGGGAVPEPATWAMLILGMGVVGGAMRRRTRAKLALA